MAGVGLISSGSDGLFGPILVHRVYICVSDFNRSGALGTKVTHVANVKTCESHFCVRLLLLVGLM